MTGTDSEIFVGSFAEFSVSCAKFYNALKNFLRACGQLQHALYTVPSKSVLMRAC
jgi:histidinol phosphatase-like PHP family hydrolase